ncbi:MAG: sugar ABC transporter substrate-binding protein [Bacillota bacterium]
MKKTLAVLIFSILSISLLLVGCSGGGDEDTLTVWAMGEEGKQLSELVEKFEEENPDIKVKVQAIPWDQAHDKLLTAVASKKGPDVLQLGTTWVPEFAEAGALLDLTPHLEEYPDFKEDNYFGGAVDSMKYEDKVVGIPWYVETRVLFYRTDLLEEVGYSEAPATWDELKDASEKLAARGDEYFGMDINLKDKITPLIFAWQNGFETNEEAGELNLDSPEFTEAIAYYNSFFSEGLSTPREGIDIVQAFRDGGKPMFMSGPWMINIFKDQAPDLEGKWSVAMLPGKETNTSSIGGAVFSVFHNSEKVDEALKFISYTNEVETQLDWLEISNTLPSRVEAWEDPVLKENAMLATFGEQLENTKGAPQIPEWEAISQELLASLERMNVGGADLETELASFREKAEALMAE